MKVAITGGFGFLGWHLACRLAALEGVQPLRLGRDDFVDETRLAHRLSSVDTVVHVAGINRADTDGEVESGNVRLAQALAEALGERPVHVVYANSIQADLDNAYGRGKRHAQRLLEAMPGTMVNVLLPNLFGEHGRPHYNSFVATFCHEIARDRQPVVNSDNQVPLLHVQAAAQVLIGAAVARRDGTVRPSGEWLSVPDVAHIVSSFHAAYNARGEIPDLSTPFARDLFNTYRANLFPHRYPMYPELHRDRRGTLMETVRSHGGTGQGFASITVPGATRGNHYHLHKIERFMVVRGEAEISLRRLYHDDVVRFRVNGKRPGLVDMPTLWTHNIRNIGDEDLITVFWADQLLDPAQADQFPLNVEVSP